MGLIYARHTLQIPRKVFPAVLENRSERRETVLRAAQ